MCLRATHGNSLSATGRGSTINKGSLSLPEWHIKQMFSLQTSFQAVRNEKGEDDFLSSLRVNNALAKPGCEPGTGSCAGAAGWIAGMLPGYLSVCEAGSSCREGMGRKDALEALKKC